MIPEKATVSRFTQFCDADALFIWLDMLRHDVHGNLGEIQVFPHSCRGGDPGSLQHIQNHLLRQLPRCQIVGVQIVGHIHEYLIDAVWIDVLWSEILQVHLIDPGAVFNIERHPW